MGCSASIACYPAKIPHFFENLKILAFYAILLEHSFDRLQILYLSTFIWIPKGCDVAWHYPRIDGLNGLRPTLRVGALHF